MDEAKARTDLFGNFDKPRRLNMSCIMFKNIHFEPGHRHNLLMFLEIEYKK